LLNAWMPLLRVSRRLSRRSLFPGFAVFDFCVVVADDAANGGIGNQFVKLA